MEQLPPQADASPPTGDERNVAMLVHVLTLISLFVGGWGIHIGIPLVAWLWKRGSSPFVAAHAREELNFQISLTLYTLIAGLLAILTLGLGLLVIVPLALVLGIIVLVVMIKASMAASRGEQYRYPFTIRFVS
jgi:uncharacterized Tic20 family protein